jgi:hypothetical protein
MDKEAKAKQELAKFERERKMMEMQKYKDDLDQTSPTTGAMTGSRLRSQTNPYVKNDFNVHRNDNRHDPMLNPMPFNIQNPYILKEMQRKQQSYNQQF